MSLYVIATMDGDGWKGPVKIGITENLDSRIRSIQTGASTKIGYYRTLDVGDRKAEIFVEKAFHKMQGRHRLHGEWFDIEPELAAQLLSLSLVTFLVGMCGATPKSVERFLPPPPPSDE